MRFSENWLRSICPVSLSTDDLAHLLTMAGLEVESVDKVGPDLQGIFVGEIVEVQPHPDADKLRVCHVNVGKDQPLQIVCGAPNARLGLKVPTATVGAKLSDGGSIKAAKLRGVQSEGMLCSAKELSLSDDHAGLMELPKELLVGADITDALGLDDNVFTLKLTANRGDCLSLKGIAREVSALTKAPITMPSWNFKSDNDNSPISVTVSNPEVCPLYLGLSVCGVDANSETPSYIASRLERSGIRTISVLVDLTNYVMLELGQPMHAFDLDKINGSIEVRFAEKNESVDLLNEQTKQLEQDMLVIADSSGPIALAGIMGGNSSAVNEHTRNVFLESAVFSQSAIAGKWRRLGFSTDASHRFERGVDPVGSRQALTRLASLIKEVCGGEVGGIVKIGSEEVIRPSIRFRLERIKKTIGIDIEKDRVLEILRSLEIECDMGQSDLLATPPSYRFDLQNEEDLIEEVVRIHGYENLPATLPVSRATILNSNGDYFNGAEYVKGLKELGFYEAITYSFVSAELENDFGVNSFPVRVDNPIAEHYSVMRTNLVGSLVYAVSLNLSHKQPYVRLFERSLVFNKGDNGEIEQTLCLAGIAGGSSSPDQWGVQSRAFDFFDMKGVVETLLQSQNVRLEKCLYRALHPGKSANIFSGDKKIGVIGELHPEICERYDLGKGAVIFELNLDSLAKNGAQNSYESFSKYPSVKRDVAFEFPVEVAHGDIMQAIDEMKESLIIGFQLFDVFEGGALDHGKKSLAFRIILQDTQKTLTDERVDDVVERICRRIETEFSARIRN
jgi:phenylalanyl-tRNA synthetase beta chain